MGDVSKWGRGQTIEASLGLEELIQRSRYPAWARDRNCLDLTVRGRPETESPVTRLWSSIKAGPRRRGRAWEKVRRSEVSIRMWAKKRNEICCVRQSPEEMGLRGGEGPDTMEEVGAEDKGRGGGMGGV